MSTSASRQQEPFENLPNIVIARRCKLNPEMLSRWEDMKTFLRLRENQKKISSLFDINEQIDPDCIDEIELGKIESELKIISESLSQY